ncbi:unnamed protein product, partial [Ixodes hexagonus]
YHQSRAVARNGAAAEPRRVSDPLEHPDAVVCFGARMAHDPGFAAAVLTAAGLGGVCAPLPPVLPGLTTISDAGSCGPQNLVDIDIDDE